MGSLAVVFLSILTSLIAASLFDLGPLIARKIAKRAVARLPQNMQARFEEQWLADINALDSTVAKLVVAVGLFSAGAKLQKSKMHEEQAKENSSPSKELQLEKTLSLVESGDREAFRRLYDQTAARCFETILQIVCNRETAEDVLQTVYLRVWQKASQRTAALSAQEWLLAEARFSSIEKLRDKDGPSEI